MGRSCEVIEIVTPKKFVLNGLWFGGKKAKTAVVFIHGLTSTAFSNHKLLVPLADNNTAVIYFGNRGHDKIAKIRKIDKRRKKGYQSEMIGEAHEVFTDCADDIQGVVDFLKAREIKDIFLAGHSTGCQKSVYFLSRQGKQRQIKGVVLLCPMSDYAAALKSDKDGQLEKVAKLAKKLVKEGKSQEILPLDIWSHMDSAQRFLSLYTPDSQEEIFSYCQKDKNPKAYKSIKIPMLIIFAERDEYRHGSIKKIEQWFKKYSRSQKLESVVIKNALHSFQGQESEVTEQIGNWLEQFSV